MTNIKKSPGKISKFVPRLMNGACNHNLVNPAIFKRISRRSLVFITIR